MVSLAIAPLWLLLRLGSASESWVMNLLNSILEIGSWSRRVWLGSGCFRSFYPFGEAAGLEEHLDEDGGGMLVVV